MVESINWLTVAVSSAASLLVAMGSAWVTLRSNRLLRREVMLGERKLKKFTKLDNAVEEACELHENFRFATFVAGDVEQIKTSIILANEALVNLRTTYQDASQRLDGAGFSKKILFSNIYNDEYDKVLDKLNVCYRPGVDYETLKACVDFCERYCNNFPLVVREHLDSVHKLVVKGL